MLFNYNDKKLILQEIEYGPLQKSELASLSDLIQGVRSYSSDMLNIRSTSQEYFNWMYFRNPAGNAIVYAARHKGRIVSSFALAPKRMQIGKQIITCGKTMDMFTHPDYQGLGLMKNLMNLVFEGARKSGITMWYVTPSVQSYPIFINKWGYRHSFQVIYLAKILRASPICRTKIRPAFLGFIAGLAGDLMLGVSRLSSSFPTEYEIREETTFSSETDELWNHCKDNRIALVRDSKYLHWRYIDNPDPYTILKFFKNGKIYGIIFLKYTLRQGMKVGEIADYLCPEEDTRTLKTMIRYAMEIFFTYGCAFAQCWAIEKTQQEIQLRHAGLNYKRKEVNFVISPNAPCEDFYNKDAWFLTQGDGNDI